MEPITTAAITALLLNLAQKGLGKASESLGDKVSQGAFNWIKSLFYKDGKPKKAMEDLIADPGNHEKIGAARAIVENSIEDDPNNASYLRELVANLSENETTISTSKNINTGNVNTGGGNFRIGDDYGK